MYELLVEGVAVYVGTMAQCMEYAKEHGYARYTGYSNCWTLGIDVAIVSKSN